MDAEIASIPRAHPMPNGIICLIVSGKSIPNILFVGSFSEILMRHALDMSTTMHTANKPCAEGATINFPIRLKEVPVNKKTNTWNANCTSIFPNFIASQVSNILNHPTHLILAVKNLLLFGS